MAYGALVTNQRGSTIVSDDEAYMTYWGKFTFTVNTRAGSSYVSTPFNIPRSVKSTCFLRRDTDYISQGFNNAASGYETWGYRALWSADLNVSGSYWQLRLYNATNTDTPSRTVQFTAYIFVDSRHTPKHNYGMEIYGAGGEADVIFRATRPPMTLHSIDSGTITIDSDGHGNGMSGFRTTPTKLAMSLTGIPWMWNTIYIPSPYYNWTSRETLDCGLTSGVTRHGLASANTGYVSTSGTSALHTRRTFGAASGGLRNDYRNLGESLVIPYCLINCANYDSIPNLPNF